MTTWRDGTSTGRLGSEFETKVMLTPTPISAGASGITLAAGQVYRDAVIDASGLTSSNLFTASGVDKILVENVRITNLAKTKGAFSFTNCDHVVVRNCFIESGGKGITFDACDDVSAIDNEIVLTTDSGSGFAGYGVLFYANSGAHQRAVISGNRITAVATYAHGIYGWGSDSATVANPVYASDISVAGNVIHNSHGGIWFSKCQRVAVTGNTLYNCSDVGIDFEGCLDSSASGNTVVNAKLGALAALYNSKRITFIGNTVSADAYTAALGGAGHLSDTSWLCAYVRDACEDISFVGNTFASTDASGWMGEVNVWKNAQTDASVRTTFRGNTFLRCGILAVGEARHILVDDNDFYGDFNDQTNGPVEIRQSDGVVVRNNRFSLVSDSAASARTTAPVRVTQNTAPTSPRATNVLVEGNQILNYPSTGIEVDLYNGTDHTGTFIVRNNEVAVVWRRTSAAATLLVSGNVLPTAPQTSSTVTTF